MMENTSLVALRMAAVLSMFGSGMGRHIQIQAAKTL
jgi:hypothetical protein